MKLHFHILLFSIIALSAAILPVIAQENQTSVEGTVKSPRGEPLPGVHVALPDLNTGTFSNNEGFFTLRNLPAGDHLLTVSMIGFRTIRDSISLSPGQRLQLDLVLEPITLRADEIVITASRRSQLVGKVPVSISTIPSAELRSRNTVTLDQALHYVPGIQVTGSQVNIRGSSGYAYGVGSRVLLLVDGVPLMGPDQGSLDFDGFPINRIRQIEVLKGPGSALYGAGALGGVINLITEDFPEQPETRIRSYTGVYQPVRYDDWQEHWNEAAQYRPFAGTTAGHARRVSDRFGFWFSGTLRTDTGYLENSSLQSAEFYSKLGWFFTGGKKLNVYTGLKRTRREQFLYWNGLNDVLRPGEISFGRDTASGSNDGLSDRFTFLPVFNHIINANLHYSVKGRIFGAAFRPLDDDGNLRPAESQTKGLRYGLESQLNTFLFEEIQLTGGFSVDANWVESEFYVGEDSLSVRNQPEGSIFLQAEYDRIPRFTISSGIRYDAYRVHTRDVASKFSPKLGFSFLVSESVTLRFSFGQGFRVPSVAERFVSNRDFLPLESNITLKPETSTGFETGVSYRSNLGRLFEIDTEITGFWNSYQNLVEPNFVPELGAFQFINLTEARIRGLEFVISLVHVNRKYRLRAAYTFLDAMDTGLNRPLLYRSKHLVQLSADNRIFKGVETGLDFRAASRPGRVDTDFSRFVDDADVFPVIYVTDFRLRFNLPDLAGISFDGTLILKNVLDYYYVERPAYFAAPRNLQLVLTADL